MRINVLTTFLFTGILCLTFGQRYDSAASIVYRNALQVVRDVVMMVTNESMIKDLGLIKNFTKEACSTNGQTWKEEEATSSLENAKKCINDVLKSNMKTARETYKGNSLLDTAIEHYVRSYCPSRITLERCMKEYSKSFEHCVDSQQLKTIGIIGKFSTSTLEFVCENDAKMFKDLCINGGVECYNSINDPDKCWPALTTGINTLETYNFTLVWNDATCSELKSAYNCIIEKIPNCKGHQITVTCVRGVFDVYLENLGCKNSSNSSTKPIRTDAFGRPIVKEEEEKEKEEKLNLEEKKSSSSQTLPVISISALFSTTITLAIWSWNV
ncbi:27 kDa glycoprotein-like [Neodiprion pinetum]|uniref:27 kDa glycoprotein-like n=1 Tax=Neodiprion pinetum TaxID=441929 RepID=UPI001EE0CAB9|nr:27 kDa hemolymph protein-like [Neodiprion pinetum]XP_046476044.1 27 kDa hemolymph protein-like [Neodiprion pinetum]XP_046476045.1 27 kDa hemolymph protein-like [Neodiprion pinetum]